MKYNILDAFFLLTFTNNFINHSLRWIYSGILPVFLFTGGRNTANVFFNQLLQGIGFNFPHKKECIIGSIVKAFLTDFPDSIKVGFLKQFYRHWPFTLIIIGKDRS